MNRSGSTLSGWGKEWLDSRNHQGRRVDVNVMKGVSGMARMGTSLGVPGNRKGWKGRQGRTGGRKWKHVVRVEGKPNDGMGKRGHAKVRTVLAVTAAACFCWWKAPQQALANGGAVVQAGTVAADWTALWTALGRQGPLALLTLASIAFFSASETAITTLWPWKVRELAEREGSQSPFALLLKDVGRFLTTILIGSTVANILVTTLVTDAAAACLGPRGVGVTIAVMTLFILIFCEIAPKTIAVQEAAAIARVTIYPLSLVSKVIYPLGRLCTMICNLILKCFGLRTAKEPFVTEDELKLVLSGAEKSGAIEDEERDMIENVLKLQETSVRQVITPLVEVVAIVRDASLHDLRDMWRKYRFSRVPIYDGRIDNITGVAYPIDLLNWGDEESLLKGINVGRVERGAPFFVPDSMNLWDLLMEFRDRKLHMAIVVNEFGGCAGIVTLEDVVEEILGEIYDESDRVGESPNRGITKVTRSEWNVAAKTPLDQLIEQLDADFPVEGYETVGGYLHLLFGRIPLPGSCKVVAVPPRSSWSDIDEAGESMSDADESKWFRITVTAGNAKGALAACFVQISKQEAEQDISNMAIDLDPVQGTFSLELDSPPVENTTYVQNGTSEADVRGKQMQAASEGPGARVERDASTSDLGKEQSSSTEEEES